MRAPSCVVRVGVLTGQHQAGLSRCVLCVTCMNLTKVGGMTYVWFGHLFCHLPVWHHKRFSY